MFLKKTTLVAAFLALAFGVACGDAPATRPAVEAPDKPAPKANATNPAVFDKFNKQHESYVALAKKGDIDLYFSGDSITDGWHGKGYEVWKKEFGGWKPGNFGISGDRTQHVLWRMQHGELDGVSPKVFVMMIGTNNVSTNSNEEIAAGNAAIIKEIQSKNPNARILLLGIFPRWISRQNQALQPRIKEINALLAKLDDGKNVKFLDIGEKFLVDGKLPADVMPDGLHPNEKGYQIWAEAIKLQLKEWLGEPKNP